MAKHQAPAQNLPELRCEYAKKRFLFVDGGTVMHFLKSFGAQTSDIDALEAISNGLRSDPTLEFRKSRSGRFYSDFSNAICRRTEFQPFILTRSEDFIRKDSDSFRRFRAIQDDLQLNTAFQALIKFKLSIVGNLRAIPRAKTDQSKPDLITTVFNLRTITTKDRLGQPAAEGVHSDGVEHTMTTFLASQNMTVDSGISRLHDYTEQSGLPWDQVMPERIVETVRHHRFLDTLFIVDTELKHSVTPVFLERSDMEATRDMLIFFTRHLAEPDHPSFEADSICHHPDMPLEFSIESALI